MKTNNSSLALVTALKEKNDREKQAQDAAATEQRRAELQCRHDFYRPIMLELASVAVGFPRLVVIGLDNIYTAFSFHVGDGAVMTFQRYTSSPLIRVICGARSSVVLGADTPEELLPKILEHIASKL